MDERLEHRAAPNTPAQDKGQAETRQGDGGQVETIRDQEDTRAGDTRGKGR